MAADDSSEPGARAHRPLPSVDIPLLREERQATRTRAAIGTAIVVAAVGGCVAAVLAFEGTTATDHAATRRKAKARPHAEAVVRQTTQAASEATLTGAHGLSVGAPSAGSSVGHTGGSTDVDGDPSAVQRITKSFGRARGFRQAVENAGASREESVAIENALQRVMDFRRCRPEDQLVFERTANGSLVNFEYHASVTEKYRAGRDPSGHLRGERIQVPVERLSLARGGRVTSSLGDALEQIGLRQSLVGSIVQAFEGKVNFTADTRAGDVFRLLVDEERIGGAFLRYGPVQAVEYVGQKTGRLRAFWFEPSEGQADYYDETGRAVQGGFFRTPVRYHRISSRFDLRRRHPILKRIMPHNGVDYAAGAGTPVSAAAAGSVTFAGMRGPNGNMVTVRHSDGYETSYCHLSRIERGVRSGVTVRQRQVIGYVGSTGRSTAPHLHFGMRKRGRFVDPLVELNGPGMLLPAGAMSRFRRHTRALVVKLERVPLGAPSPYAAASEASVEETAHEPMD